MSRPAAQAWLTKSLGINFPYVSMGKVDSLDLFGPNELIIFAFYAHNRDRYKKVLDIGANLGLHSILMAKLGWDVRGFEPDPMIFKQMSANIYANQAEVKHWNVAISNEGGIKPFTRVLNNLTGSCLVDSSKEPFGPLQTIDVQCNPCQPEFDWADLAKLDVEGHEGVLLQCVTQEHLKHLDLICELRGQKEAAAVLTYFGSMDCPIYTQKNDWKPARCMSDMPTRHQEGSIFISKRGGPWSA